MKHGLQVLHLLFYVHANLQAYLLAGSGDKMVKYLAWYDFDGDVITFLYECSGPRISFSTKPLRGGWKQVISL